MRLYGLCQYFTDRQLLNNGVSCREFVLLKQKVDLIYTNVAC